MARHLSRKLLPLAALVLLLACQLGTAQLFSQPSAPPPMGGGRPQQPIKKPGDLHNRIVNGIEVHTKSSIVTLVPNSPFANLGGFGVGGTIIVRGGGGVRSTAFVGEKPLEATKKDAPPTIPQGKP